MPTQSHIRIFKRHSQTRARKVKNPKETKAERIRKPPPPGDLRSTSVSPLLQRHLPELQRPAASLGAQASSPSLRSHAYRLQQRLLRSPISPFLSARPQRSAVPAMVTYSAKCWHKMLKTPQKSLFVEDFAFLPKINFPVEEKEDNFTVEREETQLNRFRFGPVSPAERA